MEFGSWLLRQRHDRGLTIRTLAECSGVSAATINRLENDHVAATLTKAVLICDALELTPASFYTGVTGKIAPRLISPPLDGTSHMGVDRFTLRDVEDYLDLYLSNQDAALEFLALLLSHAHDLAESGKHPMRSMKTLPFSHIDISRLLYPSRLFQVDLRYPPLSADQILCNYTNNGAITIADAGAYLKARRGEVQKSQAQMQVLQRRSTSGLSRLETGSNENVRLEDLITLDEAIGKAGEILGLYWQAARFHLSITGQARSLNYFSHLPLAEAGDNLLRTVEILLVLVRWLEYLAGGSSDWLRGTRLALNTTSNSVR